MTAIPAHSRKPRRLLRRSTASLKCSRGSSGGKRNLLLAPTRCAEDAFELAEAVERALRESHAIEAQRHRIGAPRYLRGAPGLDIGDLVKDAHSEHRTGGNVFARGRHLPAQLTALGAEDREAQQRARARE